MKLAIFNKTRLNQELAFLQSENKAVALEVKLSAAKERDHMCGAYVWWRNAVKVENYLEEQYKEREIVCRAVKNKVNFRPLLELLTQGEITKTDKDLWHICMNKMHDEYESSPKHYAKDTIARLSNYIANAGGKTGLAGYHSKEKDEYAEEADQSSDAKQVKAWLAELDDAEYHETFVAAAKDFYDTKDLPKATLPVMGLTDEGYGVVIVKKDGTKSSMMKLPSDQRVIDKLIVDAFRKDFSAMPLTMRTVLEPLKLLNVPQAVAGNPELFLEYSKVDSAWLDDKKVTMHKRLTYRKDEGDFLLSNVCTDSSVVVIAKPLHKGLFIKPKADMCINNWMRRSLEVRLLHKEMFNMFAVGNEKTFEALPAGNMYAYNLPLQNKLELDDVDGVTAEQVANAVTNYNHKPISWLPFYKDAGQLHPQVCVEQTGIKSTWNCDVDLQWVREAANAFVNDWIAAYAKKHKRTINKTMQLVFTKKGLSIGYEFEDDAYDCEKLIPMQGALGKATLCVRSTDFAFFMRQLAELDVQGAICIAANTQGVELTFATCTHQYTCVIPACDTDGERSNELFSAYTPMEVEHEFEFDFEALANGFTEADVRKLAMEVLA
jgi:hypothetical protein